MKVSGQLHAPADLPQANIILPSYYLYTPLKCPPWLFSSFQMRAVVTVSLNWSIWTSSMFMFENERNLPHLIN
jgi:hypothetical protein